MFNQNGMELSLFFVHSQTMGIEWDRTSRQFVGRFLKTSRKQTQAKSSGLGMDLFENDKIFEFPPQPLKQWSQTQYNNIQVLVGVLLFG